MSSMLSVDTPRIWVSPRWNSAEPWTRGSTPTSADNVRMSRTPRPSMRTCSVSVLRRTTFLVSARNAPVISFSRPAKAPSSSECTVASSSSVVVSRSTLPAMVMTWARRSDAAASTAAYTSPS